MNEPAAELRRLVNAYQVSQAIHVAAVLGIADRLAGGPRSSDHLAAETDTDPRSLYRLLRALAAVGVLREEESRRFSLTEVGDGLRSDADAPIAGWAAMIGRPYYWQAWGALLHSVRTGENAFRHVHGTDPWTYRAAHPEEAAIFDRAMADLARRSHASVTQAYDFGRFGTVVDVGGGNGALLAALLPRYEGMRGVLLDLPHAVAAAESVFASAGIADRCEAIAGDFFQSVPEGGLRPARGPARLGGPGVHRHPHQHPVCDGCCRAGRDHRARPRPRQRPARRQAQRPQHARRPGGLRAHDRRVRRAPRAGRPCARGEPRGRLRPPRHRRRASLSAGPCGCRRASCPPGAALASSRPSAPGGHAAPRLLTRN